MDLALNILCLISIGVIFLFSCHQLYMALLVGSNKDRASNIDKDYLMDRTVTIQLPIFNEKYVIKDLLEAVTKIRYPKELLEIQVLDDSTDETVEMLEMMIHEYQCLGFNIKHIHRANRLGFKAGALREGTQICEGDFIAIFDADFVPSPCFLEKTLPYFSDVKVGMVQSRWGHLNSSHSILTKIQAFMLDGHFVVEQFARNIGGYTMNFNGTAGVWRKDCLNDAGGWHDDTLTEDLDLSYRAQLKGWQFKYLVDYKTPAQLPMAMSAVRSQQYRWTKGAAECASKLIFSVFRSTTLTISQKIMSMFHLMNSGVFMVIITFLVSSMILTLTHSDLSIFHNEIVIGISITNVSMLFVFFYVAFIKDSGWTLNKMISFLPYFLFFLAFSLGFALHNAVAAFHGYIRFKTPFVRTPKSDLKQSKSFFSSVYVSKAINGFFVGEVVIWLLLTLSICVGLYQGTYEFLIFHFLAWIGYAAMILFTIIHSRILKSTNQKVDGIRSNEKFILKKEWVDPTFQDNF